MHYHPSPQASSSSRSFGFRSIFFATTGFDAVLVTAGFFAVVPEDDLLKPLGSGLLGPLFFCACAANHPAKSGSASSNGVALADAGLEDEAGDLFPALSPGASKKVSSSPISPHASSLPASPLSSWKKESAGGDVVAAREAGGGDLTACRCSEEADEVGFLVPGPGPGDGAGRGVAVPDAVPLVCISPAAEDILFVKEEMAQPVHEEPSLGCGVLMRGALPVSVLGGGRTVSAMLEAAFRIFCM